MKGRCLFFAACCFVACQAGAADAPASDVDNVVAGALAPESNGGANTLASEADDEAAALEAYAPLGLVESRGDISPLQVRNAMAAEEQQYLRLIEQRQDAGGLTAPGLVEPLTALGDMYFSYRDYDRAFENYASARQIMRVNDGFDTLPELPLIAKLMHTEEARGRVVEAWELEAALVTLAERNAGRIETLPVFQELAQRRFTIWERHAAGEIPPQIELGCYYSRREYNATMGAVMLTNDNPGVREQCSAGDRNVARLALLIEGRSYQMRALDAMLQNGDYASDDFWTQFTDMLATSYAVMPRARSYADTPLADLMARLLSHEPRDSAERVRRAQILVQLADMNVMRSRRLDRYVGYDTVRQQYAQAYEVLQQEGFAASELEAIFAPALPIALPSFEPNPLATNGESGVAGYIDVSFEITRQGKTRHVDIGAMSASVDRAQRRGLQQMIDLTTFRPRLVDGKLVDDAPISLRYYIGSALGPAATKE